MQNSEFNIIYCAVKKQIMTENATKIVNKPMASVRSFFSSSKIIALILMTTHNNFILFCCPSRAYSTILFKAPSDTVVNGTLNSPSELSRNTAITGLSKSFCHINVPPFRSNVTVSPLLLPQKCRNSRKACGKSE